MADDDIYGSKARYERFLASLSSRTSKVPLSQGRGRSAKYYCKNPENIKYFRKLESIFKARDVSFVRRIRIMQSLMLLSYVLECDFSKATRDDFDRAVGHMHEVYASPKSKVTFIQDIKYLWRFLFPDMDEKGRPDDTIVPYAVRHLSASIEKAGKR